MPPPPSLSRSALTLLVGLALAIALVLGGAGWLVRDEARNALLQRDAELLQAVAMVEMERQAILAPFFLDPVGIASAVADLRGVVGVRAFDASGHELESLPATFLPPATAVPRGLIEPRAAYVADYPLAALFMDAALDAIELVPVVEVWVPVSAGDGGSLQFFLDGTTMASQFAALDRTLLEQGAWLLALAWGLLGGLGGWGYLRLNRLTRDLTRRQAELESANRELTLVAKTSAVGAISAHLVHGLKGPIANLGRSLQAADAPESRPLVQGLQRQIAEITAMLRQEQRASTAIYTLDELATLAGQQARPQAESARVAVQSSVIGTAEVSGRVGNLLLLIVQNLIDNALTASPEGSVVLLTFAASAAQLEIEVRDGGLGLPASRAADPFAPGVSTKTGGTGLGLALSAQLARHLQAELSLASTGPEGTTFRLAMALPC